MVSGAFPVLGRGLYHRQNGKFCGERALMPYYSDINSLYILYVVAKYKKSFLT